MKILPHPFTTINWRKIEKIKHTGETGFAIGKKLKLKKGMNYLVGDDSMAHRTYSKKGCKLFIVD